MRLGREVSERVGREGAKSIRRRELVFSRSVL